MDFAYLWCTGAPWEVIYRSRIFSFYDQYFRFYGRLKFLKFWEILGILQCLKGHNSYSILRKEVIMVSVF